MKTERIGLSFGFSIALLSILGIFLNITSWGIQLTSILFSTFILIEILGGIALYRWKSTSPEKRFTISINLTQFKSSNILEKILTIFVFLSIFIALSSVIYIIAQPKVGDTFTNFYVLAPNRDPVNFPRDISSGQNTNLILGLINHEDQTINYTIEVWLIDETRKYNSTTQDNESIYNHAWFLDEIPVTLNSTKISNKKEQNIRWEYNYTFEDRIIISKDEELVKKAQKLGIRSVHITKEDEVDQFFEIINAVNLKIQITGDTARCPKCNSLTESIE